MNAYFNIVKEPYCFIFFHIKKWFEKYSGLKMMFSHRIKHSTKNNQFLNAIVKFVAESIVLNWLN